MDRTEFEATLLNPISFWGDKTEEEVNILLGSDVARMVNYDQRNPHHNYDLFMHTLHVVDGLPEEAPILLRVAAFFHDIGKPEVAREKKGRLVYYNHAEKSAEISAPILELLGYSKEEKELIGFYIRYHDLFITWVLPSEKEKSPYQKEITMENVREEIDAVMERNRVFQIFSEQDLWENLILLRKADICAQADQVYRDGVLIDSKEHKLQKEALIETFVTDLVNDQE